MTRNTTCFVICPIGDQHADFGKPERIVWEESIALWEKVILPACNRLGVEPLRSDKISKTGEIPEQVFRHLRDSDLVIADLTGGNPNVMYELGLRHTLRKSTIQIGERGRLPFDVAAIRTIMFMRSEGGLIEVRKLLEQALATALEEGSDYVTATRIWNPAEKDGSQTDILTAPEKEGYQYDTEEDDAPGFLEKMADAESAVEDLASILGSIAEAVEKMGDAMAQGSERVSRADATGGGSRARLVVAEQTARDLTAIADELQGSVAHYESLIAKANPGLEYIIDRLEEGLENEEWPEEFVATMVEYGDIVEQNQNEMKRFIESLAGVGKASRSLRRITGRITGLVRRMIDANATQVSWIRRLRSVIDGKAEAIS